MVVLGQHAEELAQLAERLPAGAGDCAERLRGSLGGPHGGVPAAVGEADDHRQVVRDDVVHLAGDAGTLGRRRELRLRVAFSLGPAGPLLQPRVMRAPVPYGVPEHPDAYRRHAERERDENDLLDVRACWCWRHPDGSDRGEGQAQVKAAHRDPPRAVSGQGVEQHQTVERHPFVHFLVSAQVRAQRHRANGHRDRERAGRVLAADHDQPCQQQADRGGPRRDDRLRCVKPAAAEYVRDGCQQACRQRPVDQLAMTAQPSRHLLHASSVLAGPGRPSAETPPRSSREMTGISEDRSMPARQASRRRNSSAPAATAITAYPAKSATSEYGPKK